MVATLFATLERQPMQLQSAEARRLVRHRRDGDRPRRAANRAGGRQQGRLVRLAVHRSPDRRSPRSSLALFVWIELTVKYPAVNLRLLTRRNFGLGTLANVLVGFALYGSVYLLPQYLGQAQGYNSEQIGAVMAWTGLPQLADHPVRADADGPLRRAPTSSSSALSVFGGSFLMNVHMSADYAGDQFLIPNMVRAAGQALVMGPMSGIAMIGIAQFESAGASGIFNMLRNLGGAFGTALLGTLVTKREQFHSNIIGSLGQSLQRDRARPDRCR